MPDRDVVKIQSQSMRHDETWKLETEPRQDIQVSTLSQGRDMKDRALSFRHCQNRQLGVRRTQAYTVRITQLPTPWCLAQWRRHSIHFLDALACHGVGTLVKHIIRRFRSSLYVTACNLVASCFTTLRCNIISDEYRWRAVLRRSSVLKWNTKAF